MTRATVSLLSLAPLVSIVSFVQLVKVSYPYFPPHALESQFTRHNFLRRENVHIFAVI